jgi:dTDP-4-dehydrorhamnose reductase
VNILVFGRTGQVGTELRKYAGITALGRAEADLADPAACAAAIRSHAPAAVINAAAYTSVDQAEEEEALARVINADAPAAMARICAEMDIPFVHISTDYVFDGASTEASAPEDATRPINAYGRTKLLGEEAIRTAGGRYAILRTSWVFSAHGSNFLKTILRLSKTRDVISVVEDQTGGPTAASGIAAACLSIARQLATDAAKSGTYHYSGTPDVSWYDFASEILSRAGSASELRPIAASTYPATAERPPNSRLDCSTTKATFGLARPDWRVALEPVLEELEERT